MSLQPTGFSTKRARRAAMRAKWGLISVIAASLSALWGIDAFLARTERAEVLDEARRDYEAGSAAATGGRAAAALDLLRKAHALDRSNRQYTLQLASALV